MSLQSSDGVRLKQEINSEPEKNVIAHSDLKNTAENEKSIEVCSDPLDIKLEIKEECWWEKETTEPDDQPETNFEFVPELKIIKQEVSFEGNNIVEDLPLSESPRLTREENNDSGNSTSLIHCYVKQGCQQVAEDDFNTVVDDIIKKSPETAVNNSPEDKCNRPSKKLKISNESNLLHKCVFCEKSFKHKSSLEGHFFSHVDIKPYECNMCEKSFKRKSELNRHSFVHYGIKPFNCDICKKSFTTKQILVQHFVSHSDSKPYKCDTCQKSFNRKSALDRHSFCHSDQRPFKCDSCKTTFYQKSDLKKHILWHSGEKPYKCDTCDKKFSHKSNLTKHIFCHSGSKPHKCGICERSFNRKSTLIRHSSCHMKLKKM